MRLLPIDQSRRTRPRTARDLASVLLLVGVLAIPAFAVGVGSATGVPATSGLPNGSSPCGAACAAPGNSSSVLPPTGYAWVHLKHANVTLPPARTGGLLVSNPAAGGVLLFGGCGVTRCPLADTWWYSGGIWTNLTSDVSPAPSARFGAAGAYDPSSQGVWLFGGCAPSGPLGDSWLFQNGSWALAARAGPSPSARCGAAASSFPAKDGAALFGGTAPNGSSLSDLWLFSNGSYSNLATGGAGAPTGRSGAALTDDGNRDWLVLFGGQRSDGQYLADAWGFTGSYWIPIAPANQSAASPTVRGNASFNYDPALDADLLFGGTGPSGILGDTWMLSAQGWSNITGEIAKAPAPHQSAASTFDDADGYLLLEGGQTKDSGIRNDTWALVRPLAAAVVLPYGSIEPNALIRFAPAVAGGVPPYHYNWTFGDGSAPVHTATPTHIYAATGNYSVRLVVLDLRNVLTWANQTVSVTSAPLHAVLSITPSAIAVGVSVSLSGAVTGGIPPYAIRWTGLPSGCPASPAPVISCRPETPGAYAIQFLVTDAQGANASAGAPMSVNGPSATSGATPSAGALASFDRFGWLLIPPLAAALAWAAYAGFASYRGTRNLPPPPDPAPRPECYVPPEWSETPPEFPGRDRRPVGPGRSR